MKRGKKNKLYQEVQNSIWNRWLGMFVLIVMFATASLITGILMSSKELYQVGRSFELQIVVQTGGYYFLIAAILYYCGYWVWRGRRRKS